MPEGTGRQRAATSATDPKRERILAAASELFGRQGYAGTTMARIVDALGVSKPFVYYYFRDKQEIFETLSWRPVVECFTVLDHAADDQRCAVDRVTDGLERLIRATVLHYPSSFFAYREPQVYRPEFMAALKRLSNHFYDRLCPLLEQARSDGDLDFADTKITALAACSLPGFLYTWYRPDGRLPPEALVAELAMLANRVLGLRRR